MNHTTNWLVKAKTHCFDALFPGVCALCGGAHNEIMAMCKSCQHELPRNVHACKQCGQALPRAMQQCGRCQTKALLLQEIHAPFLYQHPMDALILRFKRGGDLACGQLLAELLCQELSSAERPGLLIPVPLHLNRLRERGFDQAAQLCSHLSTHFQIPASDCLVRSRDTGSQAGRSAVQRRANVRGAFEVRGVLEASHVVLIDDVATTGATLNACALALKRIGVQRIDAWVIARA